MLEMFEVYYKDVTPLTMTCLNNVSSDTFVSEFIHVDDCLRALPLAWVILEFGTFLTALYLYNNVKNQKLIPRQVRAFFEDYSVLISVVVWTVLMQFVFDDINGLKVYEVIDTHISSQLNQSTNQSYPSALNSNFKYSNGPTWSEIDASTVGVGAGLAVPLAVLFFFDQGFCEIVTNSKKNALQKPSGFHWDLFLVGCINIGLSCYCLPWLHMALPHSDFYVRALSSVKEKIVDGQLIAYPTKVKEQRLTAFLAHILIGICSIKLIFEGLIQEIPMPVLDGLFLFLAVVSLYGNKVVERFLMIFADKSVLDDSHYSKKVGMFKINLLTVSSLVQIVILIAMGFYLGIYVKLGFPFFTLAMVPIRHFLLPVIIGEDNIEVLDGHH